jgi:mannose-1-phosphate guanylyltransferase/mannose-6-phosphate isomerase
MDSITDTDFTKFKSPGSAQICPVILSGGAGTRLWPLSRADYPKQLLRLVSERTLLQDTALRTLTDVGFAAPIVVCNQEHRFLIEKQLSEIGVEPQAILVEPLPRNTAPAIAAVALWLLDRGSDALMLIQPSDHLIADPAALHRAVMDGIAAAQSGLLVTFGITPTRPETGYGYIQKGPPVAGTNGVLAVERFVEKPEREVAQAYAESGDFLWNSGLFLLSARAYLEELAHIHPAMLAACEQAVRNGNDESGVFRLDASAFGEAPSLSIDRAVMEHTDRAAVVPVDMNWNDVGSWSALHGTGRADAKGNVLSGDVLTDGVSNSYIRSDDQLVVAIGLDRMVVVTTPDAVLVAHADEAGRVGALVDTMRRDKRPEADRHVIVHRPWGQYRTIDSGDGFQVKRITVEPGAALSLQLHYHRAEHWVVVQGTCIVQRGQDRLIVGEGDTVHIPLGAEHRLENPGKMLLQLIEVQTGAYLGEDDIVRLDDRYGRV